jgi:hypothetical protein
MKRSEAMAKCDVEDVLDGVTARYRHHQEALPDFDPLLGSSGFGVLEVVATSSMHGGCGWRWAGEDANSALGLRYCSG